jgi:urocanate hydratase
MSAEQTEFKNLILQGIPDQLPEIRSYDSTVNHAPKRKDILTSTEKKTCCAQCLAIFSPTSS